MLSVALVAGTAHAAPVTVASPNYHSIAKVSPFTGKPTHTYITTASITYFQWKYAPDDHLCAFDDGGAAGAPIDLYTCDGTSNDFWAATQYPNGTAWAGFTKLESAVGDCAFDAGGGDNIRMKVESCVEVGGQSWAELVGNTGYAVWQNAIQIHNFGVPPYECITDDNDSRVQGAWVIALNCNSTEHPDTHWQGPQYG
jgi:hypothetical protein